MNGSLSPATNSLLHPSLSITTVRITPPELPSLAMAWDRAARTNVKHSSLDMPGGIKRGVCVGGGGIRLEGGERVGGVVKKQAAIHHHYQ